MPETARSIIIDALEDIVVQVAEAPLESDDARAGIRAMNRIMNMLASKGVNLGYTIVNSLDDSITIPDGAMDALVSLLAIRLWPKYRTGKPSLELQKNAKDGLDQMYFLAGPIAATEFPPTLPVGSGNDYPNYTNSTFYPDLQDTILSESNGSISLEDNTNE